MVGVPLRGRGLEVRRIDAVASLAEMVDLEPIRDRADPCLEREPVGVNGFAMTVEP
jgi:hypothetical protein